MGKAYVSQNPPQLHPLLTREYLSDLEAPFTKDEIHYVIKHMPVDKSLGPNGFNVAFLKNYWDIMAPDFYKLIEDCYHGTANIQTLTTHLSH